MDWQTSLDRYLTSGPDTSFSDYCEVVIDELNEGFYKANEAWVEDCDGLLNQWLNKLFTKEKKEADAARIIERAHSLYLNRLHTIDTIGAFGQNPARMEISAGIFNATQKNKSYNGIKSYQTSKIGL